MSDKRNLGRGTATQVEREEHRRHPRFLYRASMTVRLKDGISMPGISVDMSTSGLSAMVSGVLTEGDTVQLEQVAGGPASARVRHKLGRLYGFEFVDLSSAQAAQIIETCRKFGRPRRAARGA